MQNFNEDKDNKDLIEKLAKSGTTLTIPSGEYPRSCCVIKGLNNFSLGFSEGATLSAFTKQKKWQWDGDRKTGLITFINCNGLKLFGFGTIDGKGKIWWNKADSRPQLIVLNNCQDVEITRIKL